MIKPVLLCILDGLGINPDEYGNAVKAAKTPVLDQLLKECPNSTVTTFGEAVGLPAGQMGNSEVGHLNIGAGKVVEQWLLLISNKLKSKYLNQSAAYQTFKGNAQLKDLHIVGLFSDGGVHSHMNHLTLLLEQLKSDFECSINLHLITDGRDTSPNQALEKVKELEASLDSQDQIKIASISGRYYAMDRDKRWERTELAYQVIANSNDENLKKVASASSYLESSYAEEVTDEFILPAVVNPCELNADSGLIFFNFRADRMRQLVPALTLTDFSHFSIKHDLPPKENVLCFTSYEDSFELPAIFEQEKITETLGTKVAKAGLKQVRLAETEKYPHVTYFMNGLSDETSENEDHILVPSPRDVKTYDEKPEMSAYQLTEECLETLAKNEHHLYTLNYANCDMVGHTGDFDAAVKACEVVDECLGKLLDRIKELDGQALIIADHGNAEQMLKADGSPHTAHTTFPVPIIAFNSDLNFDDNKDLALCDIAPMILKMLDIE